MPTKPTTEPGFKLVHLQSLLKNKTNWVSPKYPHPGIQNQQVNKYRVHVIWQYQI